MACSCMHAFLLVLLPVVALGCAQGSESSGDDDDDDQPRVDARLTSDGSQSTDARVIDARVIDAPVSVPDAASGGDGGIGGCSTHAECGSGNCCFGMLMCIPGDPLPLPPPFDCLPS